MLIFKKTDQGIIEKFIQQIGGEQELAFIPESELRPLLDNAILAVECENSLWVTEKMPGYGLPLKPQKRLNGKPGLSKSAVFLCIYPKESDDKSTLKLWKALNDPETLSNLHLVAKSYGSGAIKVEPRGLDKLPIPESVVRKYKLSILEKKNIPAFAEQAELEEVNIS